MANERKPKDQNGLPVCSGYECPQHWSRVEAGWGVATGCYQWPDAPYGFENRHLCQPEIDCRMGPEREQ